MKGTVCGPSSEHLEDRAARRKQTLVLLLQLKIAAPQLMSQCVYFEQ